MLNPPDSGVQVRSAVQQGVPCLALRSEAEAALSAAKPSPKSRMVVTSIAGYRAFLLGTTSDQFGVRGWKGAAQRRTHGARFRNNRGSDRWMIREIRASLKNLLEASTPHCPLCLLPPTLCSTHRLRSSSCRFQAFKNRLTGTHSSRPVSATSDLRR